MFGLFKPKAERLALHVERLMMTMDMSFREGKLDVTALAYKKLDGAMAEVVAAGWSEKTLFDFLKGRALARLAVDEEYAITVASAAQRYMSLHY